MQVWIDGELVDKDQAKVSVYDHGFLYGDGVFEGIRAYNGRILKLRSHLDRLAASAKAKLDCVALLLQAGAAVEIPNARGATAIQLAEAHGHDECAAMMRAVLHREPSGMVGG